MILGRKYIAQVKALFHHYGIETEGAIAVPTNSPTESSDLVEMVAARVELISRIPTKADHSIQDWHTAEKMLQDEMPITEVKIWKGFKSYTFRDSFIIDWFDELLTIEMLGDGSIEDFRKNRIDNLRQTNYIELLRPIFNLRGNGNVEIFNSENEKCRFIWDLCDLAGFSFTNQQRQATLERKANLVRNWFKRNKIHKKIR